jgi:methylated-DNA-protein-cysteine methyltransferase-like protein
MIFFIPVFIYANHNMATMSSIERILAAVRAIPCGKTAGYGEVARRAGLPGRARWVARILSQTNEADLPWHRVVRSDGRIAFPKGTEAYREQCKRLRAEGLHVENGKVSRNIALLDLDQEIWGPVK